MPKTSTDNVIRIVRIEIIYDPEYKSQKIKISTTDGEVKIPIKINDMPETILTKIKDILDIDNAEIKPREIIKEVPITPVDWSKVIQPVNPTPTYPSPITVPYKYPEVFAKDDSAKNHKMPYPTWIGENPYVAYTLGANTPTEIATDTGVNPND